MTVVLRSDYGVGDANLNNLMITTDDQRKGFHQVSLSEMETTTKPVVQEGSVFEDNGALYEATTDTSISGSPSGVTYIIFDASALTFSFTTTEPTWADDKQGWYGTGGTANDRYLLYVMNVSGSSYTDKRIFKNRPVDSTNSISNLATVFVGDMTSVTISDAQILVARDATTLTENAHCFSDESEYGSSTYSYNSFDCRPTISEGATGSGHFAGFQYDPIVSLSGGTIGHMFGYYALCYHNSGTIVNNYGLNVVSSVLSGTGSITNQYCAKLSQGSNSGSGTVTNNYGLHIDTIDDGTSLNYGIYSAGGTNYLGGSLGLGDSTPNYQLELSLDDAVKPGGGTWDAPSDKRLKENIVPADLNICYETLKKIPLVRYTWKESTYSEKEAKDRTRLGFIADDVEKEFPKSIKIKEFRIKKRDENGDRIKDEDGIDIIEDVIEDCRTLNIDQVSMALHGTVLKLMEKVELLEEKIKVLENK